MDVGVFCVMEWGVGGMVVFVYREDRCLGLIDAHTHVHAQHTASFLPPPPTLHAPPATHTHSLFHRLTRPRTPVHQRIHRPQRRRHSRLFHHPPQEGHGVVVLPAEGVGLDENGPGHDVGVEAGGVLWFGVGGGDVFVFGGRGEGGKVSWGTLLLGCDGGGGRTKEDESDEWGCPVIGFWAVVVRRERR